MKFVTGTLELDDNFVIIKRKGFTSVMLHGLKGDKKIPYESITAVQFKEASLLANGYIQFSIKGGVESKFGLHKATKDENSIVFNTKQQKNMIDLKNQVETKLKALNNKTITEPSGADEIIKFKALMDQGIITSEEFESKKKKLLGL